MTPGWELGILAASVALAAWNVSRLLRVRPTFDRLVALLGSVAIVLVVVGVSLVITEVTECTFAASRRACGASEILLIALVDLMASAALITLWLRADACRVTPRGRAVAGVIRRR